MASVEFHVSVAAPPLAMVLGLALRLTVGAGAPLTVTVVVELAEPPGPVQVIVKPIVADSGPVDWLPVIATVPVQPPDAVHKVAFVEVHVRSELLPLDTVLGFAPRVTVGTGATLTVTEAFVEPPVPEQLKE